MTCNHAHTLRETLAGLALVAATTTATVVQAAPPGEAPASTATAKPGASTGLGPTVAYNEAVRVVGGKRIVQLPPPNPHAPKATVRKPGSGYGGHAGYMIETETGLVQCTAPAFHTDGCEPSDFGVKTKNRTWIVLRDGEWQGCIGLEQPKKCRAVYPKPGSPDMRLGGVMPSEGS